MKTRVVLRLLVPVPFLLFSLAVPKDPALGQSLSWEGQTGGIFTPFAHIADSPQDGFGRPVVAFHVLDAGSVLGFHFQTSVTVGLLDLLEVGLTRSSVSSVGSEPVASLFDRGFTTVHAKVKIRVDGGASSLAPEISAGGLYRWQKEHIGADIIPSDPTQNGDLYLVATKILSLSKKVTLLVNAGARATKASFFGVAGNTPSWEVRAFGSGSLLLSDHLALGGEIVQQPAHLDAYPSAELPSTVAIFGRVFPTGSRRFGLDVAVVRIAGQIGAGLDLKAENRMAGGISFHF